LGSDPIKIVASVRELWRYPVSSLRGERLDTIAVAAEGVRGDRCYLLADLATGEIAAPEKLVRWRRALLLEACTVGDSVTISSAGWCLEVTDPALDQALTDHFGFRCGIRMVGSVMPTDAGEVVLSPRYCASALHVLSTRSLSDMDLPSKSAACVRRFRPNILVDTVESEDNWIGKALAIGSYRGKVTEQTKRCGMTMIAQSDLPEDPEILRTIVRTRERCLGVYADLASEGAISIGDRVTVG
jgi:uncharacterized protein